MAKNKFKKDFKELGSKRKSRLRAQAQELGISGKELYARKGQQSKAARVFDKGSGLRATLKGALGDSRLSRKEVKDLISGGATRKQLKRLRKIAGKGEGITSKFFETGKGAKGNLKDFYQRTIDTQDLEEISDLVGDSEDAVTEGTNSLYEVLSGQLSELIGGQEDFRSSLESMFSNMISMGQNRPGVLGVRSARRGQDGRTGMTSQFGREGLRIRSLNI